MFRNRLILNKDSVLSSHTVRFRGRYFLLALLLLLVAAFFQPFLTITGTLHQQLFPALAITAVMVTYFFRLKGLIVALVANTAAGMLAFHHWLGNQETVYAVLIALLFYSSAASAVIAYFKGREQTKKENLEWLSAMDFLTETYNHRFFQSRLSEEVARSKRSGQPLSLVFVDIDYFKQYNDANGHVMGDLALKKTAAFLNKKTRIHDIVCRYGGDEFVLILPDCSADNAAALAERMVNCYHQVMFPSKGNKEAALTLSVGISDYPGHSNNITELIDGADKALFMAKEAGRNQVKVFKNALNKDEVKSDTFCYSNCKDELVESYRKLLRDLAIPGNGTTGQNSIINAEKVSSSADSGNGNGRGNGNGNGDTSQELLIGKAIGAGHGKIDRNRLSSCLEGLKVH